MSPDVRSIADAYAPPQAEASRQPFGSAEVARLRNRSLAILGISVLVLFLGGIVAAALDGRIAVLVIGLVTAALAFSGAGAALLSLLPSFRTEPKSSGGAIALSLFAMFANAGMSLFGPLVAWLIPSP